jgi:hypothetical protein
MTQPPASPQHQREHRIYLAGSWKNQQEILLIRDILKSQGHEVDCFASEENGRISFNWSKLDDIQDKLPSMDAKDMLEVPRVQEAFREDKRWIDWCDLCILTLPSGKSSHLEAGYAKGQGKIVVIFGDLQKGDFDVMYGFADGIFRCDEIDQMVDFVNRIKARPHTPAPDLKIMTIMGVPIIPAELFAEGNRLSEALDKALKAHDAATARTATLAENKRVIDAVCKINNEDGCCKKGKDCKTCIWESLRQSAPAAQEQPK